MVVIGIFRYKLENMLCEMKNEGTKNKNKNYKFINIFFPPLRPEYVIVSSIYKIIYSCYKL